MLKHRSDLSYVVKGGPRVSRRAVHHDNLKPCLIQDIPEWVWELQKQLKPAADGQGPGQGTGPGDAPLKGKSNTNVDPPIPTEKGAAVAPITHQCVGHGHREDSNLQHSVETRHSTRKRRQPQRYAPQ